MAGKRRTPQAPAWFKADAYHAAESLDAGDWLLNLAVRGWLAREAQPVTEAALRSIGPILRRGDAVQMAAMHAADRHRWLVRVTGDDDAAMFFDGGDLWTRPELPGEVWDALSTGRVRRGVYPLRVAELYAVERRLPADVRAAGARFKPTDPPGMHPRAFGGTLDDAFGAGPHSQHTDRFVRVSLTLPEDVLRADLAAFLAAERRRLADMGGPQPYREAARLKLKPNDLRKLGPLGLLPFLDLSRWQRAEGLGLSGYAVCVAARVDAARVRELQRRAEETCDAMKLCAWFARLERSEAPSKSRRA